MYTLDWKKIKTLPSEADLESLHLPFVLLRKFLYQLNEHEFALAHSGHYVTRFIWAVNTACARGLVLGDPGGEEIPRISPPEELLLRPGCVRYEEVFSAASSGAFGEFSRGEPNACASIFERTCSISAGRLDFYFSAGQAVWANETPVLINWHTSDTRWQKVGKTNHIET
jgi:hypothetical protein